MATPAVELMLRLGLSDDELCEILAVDPISIIAGDLRHRPELALLLDLTADAEAQVGAGVLRRWLRRRGPAGVPIEHLVRRDFPAFEDALDTLVERGFLLGGGDS